MEEDYLAKSFVKITNTRNELSLHKTEEIRTVDINYNGKSKRLVLSPRHKNRELKSLSFWVCSKRSNGAVCGNPRGYGISFDKLKDEFGLNLSIEGDNWGKVVYFIKE